MVSRSTSCPLSSQVPRSTIFMARPRWRTEHGRWFASPNSGRTIHPEPSPSGKTKPFHGDRGTHFLWAQSQSCAHRAKSTSGRQQTSAVCSSRIIPRQKLIDATLPVTVDDGGERRGQIGQRIDGVELASLDERGDDCPVLGTCIVARKERVLAIEGFRPNDALDAVVVDLDAAID